MECKCETCVRKDCVDRTKQDDLRIVIGCDEYLERKMTNADRIRSMTDEELAGLLLRHPVCDIKAKHRESCSEYGCKDCILEWMQQPTEE